MREKGQTMLDKKAILSAQDLPTKEVKVPEWGGTVTVKALTSKQRDEYEASHILDGKVDLSNLRARLCVRCIVDKKGNRVFQDTDAEALGRKSGAAMDRVFAVAQKLSGLSDRDVEELAKNLPSGLGAASSSVSASSSDTPIPTT